MRLKIISPVQAVLLSCAPVGVFLAAPATAFSVAFVQNDLLAHPQYHVRYLEELVPMSAISPEQLHTGNMHRHQSSAKTTPQIATTSKEFERRNQDQTEEQSKPSLESDDSNSEKEQYTDHHHAALNPSSRMIMTDTDGQRWSCIIPPKQVHQIKAPSKKTPQEMEEADRKSIQRGYWTYEYCHKKYIRQYHATLQNGQGEPDSEVPIHTLARYQPPPAEIQGHPSNEGSLQQRSSSSSATQSGPATELAVSNEQKSLVQHWEHGDVCDITGVLRNVQVQFQCANVGDRIQLVNEPSTCSYHMVIYSPSLCKEVAFENIPVPKANDIDCKRIVTDEQYLSFQAAIPEAIDDGLESGIIQDRNAQTKLRQPKQYKEESEQPQKPSIAGRATIGTQEADAIVAQLEKLAQESEQLDQLASLFENLMEGMKVFATEDRKADIRHVRDSADDKLKELRRPEDDARQVLEAEELLNFLLGATTGAGSGANDPNKQHGSKVDSVDTETEQNDQDDVRKDHAVKPLLVTFDLKTLQERLELAKRPIQADDSTDGAETGQPEVDNADNEKRKKQEMPDVVIAIGVSSAPSTMAKDASGCSPAAIKNLVVFGDSYSDINNVYTLTNKTWPLASYDQGRFSNGPLWSEHVAKAKQYRLTSFAYGSATSDSTLIQGLSGPASSIPVPGFIQQIDTLYAPKANKNDASKTLFVVNFQGNDFFFDPTMNPQKVIDRLDQGIQRLVQLGARNILVIENFDYGLIPYLNTSASNAAAFSALAAKEQEDYKGLEKKLTKAYGRSVGSRPFRTCKGNSKKVNLGYFKLGEFYKHLYQSRQLKRLGITDVIHGCVSNDYKTVCTDAGKHFFWDAFHPSKKVHQEVANAILHLL
ncbi:Protein OS-9 [Mortierella sp. GBA30]|nr:Protein OS-9 [Mortierella sp. GBA30]